MYAIESFVQGTILIIGLTVIGLVKTETPFVCLLLAGLLLCIICERSLSDEREIWLFIIQLALSCVFVLVADCYISYLVFLLIVHRMIFVPSILCIVIQSIIGSERLPLIIGQALILAVASIVIYIVQHFIEQHISVKNQVAQAVSVTAVNEMYAKKLNQELIIKNYLADKNARLEERENISRNIHNSVGHSITAAIMTLEAADMLYDTAPDKAREKMNTANERIRLSLDSIRQAVRVLDSDNKYVSIKDFISELTAVTDDFVMDTMIKVYTDFGNVNENVVINHEHTEFLTGALQEFLSNGVRHGGADTFTVTLMADSRNLRLKVSDNGKSDFSKENAPWRIEQGFGLRKIASYVGKCGGSTMYYNDEGFKAEITLKLFKEDMNG